MEDLTILHNDTDERKRHIPHLWCWCLPVIDFGGFDD